MNYKSIVSLISFCLLSTFYVPSASAGPTYVNVEIQKYCAHRDCSIDCLGSLNTTPKSSSSRKPSAGPSSGMIMLDPDLRSCQSRETISTDKLQLLRGTHTSTYLCFTTLVRATSVAPQRHLGGVYFSVITLVTSPWLADVRCVHCRNHLLQAYRSIHLSRCSKVP